jgi:hypothetical protein
LHRPRLAAAALGLFATERTLVVTILALPFVAPFADWMANWTGFRLQLAIAGLAAVLQACGLITLWLADLTRGGMNPWPQRLMTGAGLLANTLSFCATSLFLFQHDPSLSRYGSFYFFQNVYMPLMFLSLTCALAGWSFALVYVLQVAHWQRSRRLARAGSLALGYHLLALMAYGAMTALWWSGFARYRGGGMALVELFLTAMRISATLAVAAFFLITALWLAHVNPSTPKLDAR